MFLLFCLPLITQCKKFADAVATTVATTAHLSKTLYSRFHYYYYYYYYYSALLYYTIFHLSLH